MSIRRKIAELIHPDLGKQYEDRRLRHVPIWKKIFPTFREWSTEQAVKEGLKASVWVYACVRKISEAVSSVPWYVEAREGDGWEREERHPVEQLLTNPNPNPLISGTNLLKLEVNHRQLGGNAIWHKVMYNEAPVELWPIKPDRIYPLANKDGTIANYEYRPEGTAERILIPPEEIIHFQFVDPSNFLWGLSPLQAAAKIVDTDVEAIKHNKKLLENSAISSGVLSYNKQLTREQWEEANERVAEHMKNPGYPWVLGNEATWNNLSMSLDEMQLDRLREMSMLEVHAAFDVDPLLTGYPDRSGRANKREAKQEFWQDNIIPYLESLKEGLENNLLIHFDGGRQEVGGEPQLRMMYDLSGVAALQEDQDRQSRIAERYWRMGVPLNQVNDRLELGFEDVPGGDTPRGTPQLNQSSRQDTQRTKSKGWSEEEKTIRWKSVEEDRLAWEDRIVEEVERRFGEEFEAVLAILEEADGDQQAVLEALDAQEEEWHRLIEDIYIPVLEHFGQEEFERLEDEYKSSGPDSRKQFDAFEDRIQQWLSAHAVEQATLIKEASKDELRRIFDEASRENWTVDEIGRAIDDTYNIWTTEDPEREFYRSMRISRTETQVAQGKATFEGAVQAEEELDLEMVKIWVSSRDARVRDEHDAVDGETVPLRERFSNGLMHPGDPDGAAEEVINCRCTEVHEVVS